MREEQKKGKEKSWGERKNNKMKYYKVVQEKKGTKKGKKEDGKNKRTQQMDDVKEVQNNLLSWMYPSTLCSSLPNIPQGLKFNTHLSPVLQMEKVEKV